MRQLIRDFVEICSRNLDINESIYEFGSLRVDGQNELADLRPLFPNKKYVGADMRSGLGVDVILNLHSIHLSDESVGAVLILDTLEHVEYPHKAISEAYRILKPDGILIISSVMNFPIHDYPNDFWRFTPEAFKSLLGIFDTYFVDYIGNEKFPHTIIGIGFKSQPVNGVGKFYESWYNYSMLLKQNKYDWRIIIEMIIPPLVLKFLKYLVFKMQYMKLIIWK